jgi:hypothetical protein
MKIPRDKEVTASLAVIVACSAAAGMILSFIVIVLASMIFSTTALITERGGMMYKVRICALFGDCAVITARSDPSKTAEALAGVELSPDLMLYFTDEIVRIEFEQPASAAVTDKKDEPGVSLAVIGAYNVTLAGFKGTLSIWTKDGYVGGYIQFPQWAKGVKEPLKNLRVTGDRITFTRSVENAEEQKRVGSPTFYVQNFEGSILNGGRRLKGRFTNHGVKESWDAERR